MRTDSSHDEVRHCLTRLVVHVRRRRNGLARGKDGDEPVAGSARRLDVEDDRGNIGTRRSAVPGDVEVDALAGLDDAVMSAGAGARVEDARRADAAECAGDQRCARVEVPGYVYDQVYGG